MGDGYVKRLGCVLTLVSVDRQCGLLTRKHRRLLKTRIEIGFFRAEVGSIRGPVKVGSRGETRKLHAVFGNREVVPRVGDVVRVASAQVHVVRRHGICNVETVADIGAEMTIFMEFLK